MSTALLSLFDSPGQRLWFFFFTFFFSVPDPFSFFSSAVPPEESLSLSVAPSSWHDFKIFPFFRLSFGESFLASSSFCSCSQCGPMRCGSFFFPKEGEFKGRLSFGDQTSLSFPPPKWLFFFFPFSPPLPTGGWDQSRRLPPSETPRTALSLLFQGGRRPPFFSFFPSLVGIFPAARHNLPFFLFPGFTQAPGISPYPPTKTRSPGVPVSLVDPQKTFFFPSCVREEPLSFPAAGGNRLPSFLNRTRDFYFFFFFWSLVWSVRDPPFFPFLPPRQGGSWPLFSGIVRVHPFLACKTVFF